MPPNRQEPQSAFFFFFLADLKNLHTFFSRSSKRWAIFNQELEVTLKPLSETRWECRLDGVKAIRFQLYNICEAIENVRDYIRQM
jgi:hypothetical protein